MQKIVVDTNVIVSSLIQRSYPYKIVHDLFIDDKILLCVSEELMHEYYDVLSRPKFSKFPDFFARAESLLVDIELKSQMFVPMANIDLISDKDDNMILELASECKADFIITGNTNDFTFPKFRSTLIINPKDYWEYHAPKK
jgi:putative PIN family toxin of toxin-antitoxin system